MGRKDANASREGDGKGTDTDPAGFASEPTEEQAPPAEPATKPDDAAGPEPEAVATRSPAPIVPVEEAEPMGEVMKLAEMKEFDRAADLLQAHLKKRPKDDQLLHNLGVIFTEQHYWAEAEEVFMKAFDIQRESGKLNLATMFGLGTVLTEQGTTFKLLQGEALFRDCLQRAVEAEEKGVQDTYRSFFSLAENLERQKRWTEAAEVWQPTLDLASSMFGENGERTVMHRNSLARAMRLARWQRGIRLGLWSLTLATPVLLAWIWRRSGLGAPWDLLLGRQSSATPAVASSAGSHETDANLAF